MISPKPFQVWDSLVVMREGSLYDFSQVESDVYWQLLFCCHHLLCCHSTPKMQMALFSYRECNMCSSSNFDEVRSSRVALLVFMR
jgi:hypothetical protein